jgi:hypothetical protein
MQLMTSILGRYFPRFLTMAYLLVAVIPLVTGTAHAQIGIDYWILDPLVVNTTTRQSVTLTVQTSGLPTMVKLTLADGSEKLLENQGGGRFITTILHEQAIYGYSADNKHNFVGHLDLGSGSQSNLFINVDDGTIPATVLLDLDANTRISSRVANFLLPESEITDLDISRITGLFYEYFPDDFDFINIISEAATRGDAYFSNVKNSVQGLGLELFDDSHRFGSSGRLEGVIVYPLPEHFDLASPDFLRTMGYNWMNHSTHPALKGATPQWPISDLAGGIMGYQAPGSQQYSPFPYWFLAELAGDYRFIYQTGNYFLVSQSLSGDFNSMELYLMGLLPAQSVLLYRVLDDQHQEICAYCLVEGPLVNYHVRDLIARHGVRNPDYSQARKDFKVATIIVSSNRLLSTRELRYFDHMAARGELSEQVTYSHGFTKGLANPFHLATSGRGTLNAKISANLNYIVDELKINPGMNDAWYSPATNGQGFLISVFPKIKQMFLAWFTYDTERPPKDVTAILGDPGHRWLTAQGPFEGDTANLTIFVTEGGVFDSAEPVANTNPSGDGTMTIEFADCTEGLVSYEITSLGISGEIPIQRIVPNNISLCETLSTQ